MQFGRCDSNFRLGLQLKFKKKEKPIHLVGVAILGAFINAIRKADSKVHCLWSKAHWIQEGLLPQRLENFSRQLRVANS